MTSTRGGRDGPGTALPWRAGTSPGSPPGAARGGAPAIGYGLIDTDFGPVGLAWSERGIVRLQLPDGDAATTRRRLLDGLAAAESEPPARLAPAIGLLSAYFAGRRVDLTGIALDLSGVPDFHLRLYREMLHLGWGEVVTYGGLAARVGAPGAARAVGRAMGMNRIPVIIPCHRVLASGHRMGGFSAPGGAGTKLRLLAMEGVRPGGDPGQLSLSF